MRRPGAGHSLLRCSPQLRNAVGIEDEKEAQPPVGELPEEDACPDRGKDPIAACLCHGLEKGGEQPRVFCLDGSVHELIPRQEEVVGGRKREVNEEEETEESKNKGAPHTELLIAREG